MEFRYTFELGRAEQVRGSAALQNRRWDTRIGYGFLVAGVLAVFGIQVLTLARGGAASWLHSLGAIGGGLFGGLAIYLTPHWMVWLARKNNRMATAPYTYLLTPSGFESVALGARSTLEWQNFSEAWENKEFFFLFVSKGFAVLVPKRVVPTGELAGLREALRQWMGDRARL